MWAARSLKYNGLTLQKMMVKKFVGELEVIRDSFAYTNLAGKNKIKYFNISQSISDLNAFKKQFSFSYKSKILKGNIFI
jgi:hypothetical protein